MYKDELICDLLETYHIFFFFLVPVNMLRTLCSGLGPDSRLGMKLSKRKVPIRDILLALICDCLSGSEDSSKRIAPSFFENEEEESLSFRDGNEFEKERRRILGG